MKAILHWTVAIAMWMAPRIQADPVGWTMCGEAVCASTNVAAVVVGTPLLVSHARGCLVDLPGATPAMQTGAPSLPFYTVVVPLLPGCRLEASVVGGEYSETNEVSILPVAGLPIAVSLDGELRLPPEQTADEAIYSMDEWWPPSLVEVETAWQGHQQWARLRCTPFRYNPVKRVLRMYSRIDVQLVLSEIHASP